MHICQSLNLFRHSNTFSEREQDSDLAASRLQRGHRIQGHLALNEMQRWEVVRTLEFESRKNWLLITFHYCIFLSNSISKFLHSCCKVGTTVCLPSWALSKRKCPEVCDGNSSQYCPYCHIYSSSRT